MWSKSKLIDTKGSFGENYFTRWIGKENDPKSVPEHELVMTLMPPQSGDRILDVGYGKGRLGFFILSQQPDVEITFSDVSSEAAKYLDCQKFIECSMASLPFRDNSFDKIFCMHVLAHFKDGETGIQEAFRVLKPGGKLMVLTPNRYYVYLSWLITAIKKTKSGKRFKYNTTARWLYSRTKLRRQLKTRPWSSIEYSYFESAPRLLPFEWLRAKLIAVATK